MVVLPVSARYSGGLATVTPKSGGLATVTPKSGVLVGFGSFVILPRPGSHVNTVLVKTALSGPTVVPGFTRWWYSSQPIKTR